MEKNYAVGIDIGGTNTNVAIVDRRGTILSRATIFTQCGGSDISSYISQLAEIIERITAPYREGYEMGSLNDSIAGIGIGAPCANYATGCIEAATDLPWPSPVPLCDILRKATGYAIVSVTNDANAAAAGEMNYGAARGMNNFIMLTLGTGVGSGVVCNGTLLTGHRGFAGELGHCRTVGFSDRPCACGRRGCLQTYASAKGVVTTARQLLKKDKDSVLNNIPDDELSAKLIYNAARNNDRTALHVFEITGEALGQACADFASLTDPQAIILFGGVARASDFIIPSMRRTMEDNILHLYGKRIDILQSCLPEDDAALLGASALVWGEI